MLDLPPLFDGRAVADDPFEAAIAAARKGCDAGLILYRPDDAALDAALVLAPEVSLGEAATMILVAGNGFADAFGALSPPEIALHLEWPGRFRIEGAVCGGLRAAAPDGPDDVVPDWLVIGFSVPVDRRLEAEPGERPDETDLKTEGVDLTPADLLAAWARHTLNWIARWEDEGPRPVHRDWLGRAWRRGERVTVGAPAPRDGIFQGLDEHGGILLKGDGGTDLVPLTATLERRRC